MAGGLLRHTIHCSSAHPEGAVTQSEGGMVDVQSQEQRLRWGPRLAIVQPALSVQTPILTLRRQVR